MPTVTEGPALVLTGRLIDGTGAKPIPDAVMVIQDDIITAVGSREEVSIPANAQVIDLPGATILPGFINTHVHNAFVRRNLTKWAKEGVTTVRDVGAPVGEPTFVSRDRLRAEPKNARVLAAGPLVTVPEGYPIVGNGFPSLTVTSPKDARQKIAQLCEDGADVIKIVIESGPALSLAEAKAIVETAHEYKIPVTVHVTQARYLKRALDAGVDDIVHAVMDHVSDRVLEQMVEDDVSWVPTFHALRGEGMDNLRRFVEVGGRVALGNDGGYLAGLEIGMPMREIEYMQSAGLTPMQIIVASTQNAAYVCRLADTLGTLEVGKVADVLAVNGDPLDDLQVLEDVRLVIHDGVIIHDQDAED
jgi:imidazolonepropionase-like amidohydrolase